MFVFLEGLLGSGEKQPQNPEVIIPLGYGTCPDMLANGTRVGVLEAICYKNQFPNAVIAFGNSRHCFTGSDQFELLEKVKILSKANVSGAHFVSAGPVDNTITELRAIKSALEKRGLSPKEVLLIYGAFHSRSVLYIFKRVFPGVVCSLLRSSESPWQPDAVFWFQRGKWRWFLANVLREITLRTIGLDAVGKIKHHSNQQ